MFPDETETRFADGNLAEVVRVGDTVRRAAGAWTPTIHALLSHLERVGFDGAPRARGFDERGREVLTFIEGETIPADMAGFRDDRTLVDVARLLRSYHDATLGFVPAPDAAWDFCVGAPRKGEVICHNDVGPWNVVAREGRPVALIDWDLAAPAPREWDVAYALWRFVPLYETSEWGPPAGQGRRMRVFCDAYGLTDRHNLVDLVDRRIRAAHDTVVARAAAGLPAYVRLVRDGHVNITEAVVSYLRRHRLDLLQHLEPP